MRHLPLICIFIGVFSMKGITQEPVIHSQYLLNEFILNPALAGSDGGTSINLTGRKQWWGWEVAPETYLVSVSGRMLKASVPFINKRGSKTDDYKSKELGRVGLGGSITKDVNGAINITSVKLTYAYHIPMNASQLSIGVSLLGNQFYIDKELLPLIDLSDPFIGLLEGSSYSPDANFGMDFSTQKFHIGFSVHNLLQIPIKYWKNSPNHREIERFRQYYLFCGYRNNLKTIPKWEYETVLLARLPDEPISLVEMSLRVIYNKQYWFGLSYRTTKDLIAFFGLKYDKFYFGYSFDYGFNELSKLTKGTHELNLAIKLGGNNHSIPFWESY